jgi:hypothetical protein
VFLAAIMFFVIVGGYYYSIIPDLTNIEKDSEGVLKSTSRISHQLLSYNFIVERTINKEEGVNSEQYYLSSTKNLYMVDPSDSLSLRANKIDRDLSSESSEYGGLLTKKITVTKPAGSMPVRFVAPAISLQQKEYIKMARTNVLFFILTLIYAFVFFWFLRKFIKGLRNPVFFTRQNTLYLYTTASLVFIAPFLEWGWSAWISPDLFSQYQFTGASKIGSISEISLVLIFFGLILLVIGWCFDQGVKLQKEQDLTI